MSPSSSSTTSTVPKKKPGLLEAALQLWQCWALRHPRNILARIIMPWICFIEGIASNKAPFFPKKRDRFGPNFCAAGAVILGDYDAIEEALTTPNARTHRLGQSQLDPDHLPGLPDGNRLSLLLAMSQQECGGNGNFEAFRACFEEYITNEAALDRSRDVTAGRLLDKLVLDYKYMGHDRKGEFFVSKERGLTPFIVRFTHYCLLGMDPFDLEVMDELQVSSS